MHPFTSATLAVTARKIDNAIALLEQYAETCGGGVPDPQMLFARGYGEMYRLRSLLQEAATHIDAAAHLEHMAERMLEADADRPPMMVIR